MPQQMEQPVLSPDAADDEMGLSYHQHMSIQQHQVYHHNNSGIDHQGRMYDEECPQYSEMQLNIDLEDHEADHGDADEMDVETAEKIPLQQLGSGSGCGSSKVKAPLRRKRNDAPFVQLQ